ncbi:MAG TPA: class I SAM-dependent methyltransferase [Candidatus Pelagibacter sp.]|nr:class I SAM-dependent methyltransferase [Candidatus Pelagibacter sp.]
MRRSSLDKKILDQQSQYWEKNFLSKPEMFGLEPSKAAINTLKTFKEKKIKKIVDLGAGLGRDTIFFAKNSINVEALDYSPAAIKIINKKSLEHKLSNFISTKIFDVRKQLPFEDSSVDACFSHMLYCMALSTSELKYLNSEICRILKPGGINIYTVRHTGDGDYKNGIHIGEDLYENDGFIVHFFSEKKVRQLANEFNVINIESFEEGTFPRKLFRVILKKK